MTFVSASEVQGRSANQNTSIGDDEQVSIVINYNMIRGENSRNVFTCTLDVVYYIMSHLEI